MIRDVDDRLLRKARRGNRAATDALFEAIYPDIRSIIGRQIGDRDLAENAVQEALLKIFRSLTRFRGESTFSTWCYRIAVNCAIDQLRAVQRLSEQSDQTLNDEVSKAPSTAADIATRIDVQRALAEIHPDQRVVVVLADVVECDYQEIADILGIPIGTVRSRLSRGREQLRHKLHTEGTTSEVPTSNTTTRMDQPPSTSPNEPRP